MMMQLFVLAETTIKVSVWVPMCPQKRERTRQRDKGERLAVNDEHKTLLLP